MLGGGEHSFLDFLTHLSHPWNVLAVLPGEAELAKRFKQKGIKTKVIPLPSIRPWYALNILSTLRTYFNLCRRNRPVLIYANGSRAALYGGVIGRILHMPVIWHCRIADSDIYLDPFLIRLSSRIIANSHATANRFRRHSQAKVRVVYNGLDIEWLRDTSGPRPGLIHNKWRVILVVARVSRWKRHDLALSAFEQIAKSNPDCHLVCLGAKDASELEWWDNLQDRTRRSAFFNRIHWVGQVEDVRPWYRAADVMLLPSENEPFGRVLVEAMAVGVPIVATSGGGVPEIVRHGKDGLLVDPASATKIAEAVISILKGEVLKKRLISSAKKRAEYFSLDAHITNMVRIFEGLLCESLNG